MIGLNRVFTLHPRGKRLKPGRILLGGLLLAGVALAIAPVLPVYAFSFVVNSNGDLPDADLTDSLCQTTNNNCTGRAAIEQANTSPFGSTITFSSNMTITPATALPPIIQDDITISGIGHDVILDGSLAVLVNAGTNGLHIRGAGGTIIQRLRIRDFGVGINIDGTGATTQNNIIGTNGDGSNDSAERIIITGSGFYGVRITGLLASGNTVAGNQIGNTSSPNQTGIFINDQAHHNLIGTDGDGLADANERNEIRNSTSHGIGLVSAQNNVIAGNYIGLDTDGSTIRPNGAGIIMTFGADNNLIGTDGDGVDDADERNIISGNLSEGILIDQSHNNRIAGNYIGTNANGTQARANGANGIWLQGGSSGTIIGTNSDGLGDDIEGNVISGNAAAGIATNGADNNVIAGNYIGTNASGTSSLGNANGINLSNSDNNTVGTNGDGQSDAFEGNVISGNDSYGIFLFGSSYNTFSGNLIGTDVAGTAPLGNGIDGFFLMSGGTNATFGNVIGGIPSSQGNVIAYNQRNGVSILTNNPQPSNRHSVLSNSIFSNGELGIDVAGDGLSFGVTLNDFADRDSGTNDFLNFPTIALASSNGISTFVNADIIDGLASHDFLIQFFSSPECDPSGYGEGQTFIGNRFVTTDASGNSALGFTSLQGGTPVGHFITATATSTFNDPDNTSEFSLCVEVGQALTVLQIEVIKALIAALADSGQMNDGQSQALTSTLDGAIRQIERDNDEGAVRLLEAFIKQVTAFVRAGVLPAEVAQEQLINPAREIIIELERPRR